MKLMINGASEGATAPRTKTSTSATRAARIPYALYEATKNKQ